MLPAWDQVPKWEAARIFDASPCIRQGRGNNTVSLEDLDRAASEDGMVRRPLVSKYGYSIGRKMWSKVSEIVDNLPRNSGGRPQTAAREGSLANCSVGFGPSRESRR